MRHFAKVSKDVVSVKLICNYTVFYSYILLNNEINQSELKLTHTPSFIRTSIFRVEPRTFCEESLGNIKFRAFPKSVGPRILSLGSVDYFGTSEH